MSLQCANSIPAYGRIAKKGIRQLQFLAEESRQADLTKMEIIFLVDPDCSFL